MIYEILRSMTVAHFITLGVDIMLLLVCLIGLIMAIIGWKKHPAVSTITIFSLLLAGAGSIGLFFLWFYLFEIQTKSIFEQGGENKSFDLALSFHKSSTIFLLLVSIFQFVLVPLFLAGILIGRGKTEKSESSSR